MSDEDKKRLQLLADKLDTGGLTTAEQFELARLVRAFMEQDDQNMVEMKRLLRLERPSGWGYPH